MNERKQEVKKGRFVDPRIELIGARIQSLRIAAGHSSQEKAAWAFGISRSQWADYEKGVEMKMTTFLRVCDALNVTPAEFFSEGFE